MFQSGPKPEPSEPPSLTRRSALGSVPPPPFMSFKHLSFALLPLLLLIAGNSLAQVPSTTKDPVEELRGRWLAARGRALKPLDDAYIKQLQELKVAETKKGNMEGALRVDAEIKEVTAENAI